MTLCLCECGEELPERLPGKKERKYINKRHAAAYWNKIRRHEPKNKKEYKPRARKGDREYEAKCPACPSDINPRTGKPKNIHMVKLHSPPTVMPRIYCPDIHYRNRSAEDSKSNFMSW